jgi:alpha-L-fucosidase
MFEATWESLSNYTVPEWYQDAKFGIFIHWGPYCVPAFGNEWYPRNMYWPGTPEYEHHIATHGPHTQFGYKDFIPQFTAEKFDADEWADLFHRAGAKYVVPVAEHHNGFAMYDSAYSRWTAAKMGPKRDIVGELAAATRKRGMAFGVSSHRAEHWFFMGGGRTFNSDVNDPAFDDFYGPAKLHPRSFDLPEWSSKDWQPRPDGKFLEDWLARCTELVDRYQPQVFWFDWWIEQLVFAPYLQRFAAHYYNRALEWGNAKTGYEGVAINYKHQSFPEKAAVLDIERGQLQDIRHPLWQTDTAVSKNSWGYVHNQDYKAVDDIVGDLIDIVSKNGVLLLNIGPTPDGTIPEPEQRMLLEIGDWLRVNGEAIYGTRPWKVYGEGPTEVVAGSFNDVKRTAFTANDIRFTTKGAVLYAFALAWPTEALTIRALSDEKPIQHVTLLGSDEPLRWTHDAAGLTIQPPTTKPCAHAFVFKIE